VLPTNGNGYDLAAVYADMPDTVEMMHDQSAETLADFLQPRRDCYDVIWIARTHNLDKTVDALEAWVADCAVRPRVVLDTEAVAATRSAARAKLRGESFGLIAALVQEFSNVDFCDEVVAVNGLDAGTIRNLGIAPVTVLGHMRVPALTPRPWAQRSGLLFVGSIHAMESPNYEGLVWFIDEVLPLIEAELGPQTRLTVIGHLADGVSLERFRDNPRVTLRGPVVDAAPAYDAARVFVAPTRWAGGVPYKVHEAASFGVPVAATALIAAQLGWDDGLLAADASDAAGFAAAVLRLHQDEATWTEVRARAAARLEAENAAAPYVETIRRLVAPAKEG
jgi:glycosyltransferase involved in cell wall biosynthesis